jgi:CDP-6-deoxy-D-xylo-4-hexulose-3-dehydrase
MESEINELIEKHRIMKDVKHFPLVENILDKDEICAAIQVLLSDELTMGKKVRKFEEEFAAYIGSEYAVMVNSGSSANLLAFSVASNQSRSKHFLPGDEILIPAVCWSTSLWPLIQMNLKPIFVDVEPLTLNMDLLDAESKITSRTRGVLAVHVMGNSCDMNRLVKIIDTHNLICIEDTCEALGSSFINGSGSKYLGTTGSFGTFSFFYSHHITTIEGGMVICNSLEDYNLLVCLRAHGWTRQLTDKKVHEEMYPDIDARYLFINIGYNLRPMEIQGSIGSIQLSKLSKRNNHRIVNRDRILDKLNQTRCKYLIAIINTPNCNAAWFGLCFIVREISLISYLCYLTNHGVENRPIVTGNILRQPAVMNSIWNTQKNIGFEGSELIHHNGVYIGLSPFELSEERIESLVSILVSYVTSTNIQ